MLIKWKRFFAIFIIVYLLLLGISNAFPQTYEIETSQGTQILEIPEGSTIEETLIEISKMYWEERYDLEELLIDHADLIQEVRDYELTVEDYKQQVDDLITSYDELMDLYNKKDMLSNFIFIPTIGFDYGNDQLSGKFGFGLLLFKRLFMQLEVGYPYSMGFTLGYKLF